MKRFAVCFFAVLCFTLAVLPVCASANSLPDVNAVNWEEVSRGENFILYVDNGSIFFDPEDSFFDCIVKIVYRGASAKFRVKGKRPAFGVSRYVFQFGSTFYCPVITGYFDKYNNLIDYDSVNVDNITKNDMRALEPYTAAWYTYNHCVNILRRRNKL